MSIQYFEPINRAWERTRRMLFRPFRLEFWMVLGFAAFLSNLGQSGASWNGAGNFDGDSADGVALAVHDFLHLPGMLALFCAGFVALLLLGLVFGWLSARGRFIFLDDVLHERAAIVAPWRRYARSGNSLFVLELILGLGILTFLVLLFHSLLFGLFHEIWEHASFPEIDGWAIVSRVLVALPVIFLAVIFRTLTRHFVVPVMWKYDLGAVEGWARFWPLLAGHPLEFIVYLLLLLLLYCGLAAAIVVVGLCTCCIGFILIAIPYVGSVVLLPVYVTLCGFGPEFLAQFGAEWDVRLPRGTDPGSPSNPAATSALPEPPAAPDATAGPDDASK